VRPSMGSVGDAYDNALCESFFATLECELLERRRFRSQTEAVSRSSASSKPGTTRAGATPASAISLPLPMRRPTHARRSPPLQPMIGHRTDAARISGPTPPSRTRLRRAAPRSSILDRDDGPETGPASLQCRSRCPTEPKTETVHQNGASSGLLVHRRLCPWWMPILHDFLGRLIHHRRQLGAQESKARPLGTNHGHSR